MLLISKILLKMAKGLWPRIIVIVCLKLLVLAGITLFARTLSGFLGGLADSGPGVPVSQALLRALAASLVVLLGEFLIGEAEYRCTAKARLDLRSRIFSRILLLDVGSIEKIGLSQSIASVVDGVEYVQVYYSKYLPGLLYCFLAPVYLFFRLKDSSFPVALFLLVVTVALLPANNLIKKIGKGRKENVWESFRELTGYYLESLRGLSTLKLFNQDEQREHHLRVRSENFNRHLMELIKSNFESFLFSDGVIYLSVFASVVFVCSRLARGQGSLEDAIMILMLGYGFFASVRQLMNSAHQALTGIAAAEAIADILAIDTTRPLIPRDPSLQDNPPAGIRLEGVSYTYPGRDTLIRRLDMEVQKDKVTALVGLSGGGKSTIAALFMRFFDPQEGQVSLEGTPYAALSVEELRRHIALVPQQVGIFSGTIAENLRIAAPAAEDGELREVLHLVRLGDWLAALPEGLGTDVGDAGARLSGGQRQKLGIARVLLSKAPYIIFDEATSSVDVESERDIWACIAELARTRTLFIISHRLSTIRDADRIYVLQGGGIAESGTHEELFKHGGVYYNLVQEQTVLESLNKPGQSHEQ
jgi:ATP-binding cassette subfamily C protein